MFDLIAFDADDTLWQNERLFLRGREKFAQVLAAYNTSENIDEQLQAIEISNLKYYGYGVMSFILSSLEAAASLTSGKLTATDVLALLNLGKEMISADVELLEGVEKTLAMMKQISPLMLITKGEPNHQYSKLERSGIKEFFRFIEVVHDKSLNVYSDILNRAQVLPDRFLMIGNSIRSDILPVLELGGWAIHLPNNLTWSHEIVAIPESSRERFFELPRIELLPGFIENLAKSRSGGG